MKEPNENQIFNKVKFAGCIIIAILSLWGCQNQEKPIEPNPPAGSGTHTVPSGLVLYTVTGTSTSDSIYLKDDWNDDTIQLGANYDLVRFVEFEKDVNGKILWCYDKKMIYENGKLKSSVAGDLEYNSDGQVTSVLEADYYRSSKIFSNASYLPNGWLKSFSLTGGTYYPMGSYQAGFNYEFDLNTKIQNSYGQKDTLLYVYNNSLNLPSVIRHIGNYYGNNGVFYKYLELDSIVYNSLGDITEIYFGYLNGNLTASSLIFGKPTMKLTSSTEYSGYKIGKAAKFMVWYDLQQFTNLYNYMYFPPNYVEAYNNGYFFSSRRIVNDYTLNQSTFKTNTKGDVVEINRVKTERDGTKKYITQRFKYGNI